MKQDQLDSIIKEKLEHLKADHLPSDWDAFEEKLSMAQGEPATTPDEEFDQLIFSKMNQYKASGWLKEEHWLLLEKQMYFLANLRQRLLQYKLVEVLALTLLLMYVVEADAPGSRTLPQGASPTIQAKQQPENDLHKGQISQQVPTNDLLPEGKTDHSESLMAENQQPANLSPSNLFLPEGNQIKKEEKLQVVPISPAAAKVASNQKTAAIAAVTPDLNEDLMAIHQLPAYQMELDDWHSPDLANSLRQKKLIGVQISMLGGADYNHVMTPEDLSKGIKAFERFSAGYRGGLLADFGRQDSRVRVGSGFIYSAKQYGVDISRISGSILSGLTAESLKDIELNMVNIPVFARYNFWQSQRWSVFAHGGMAMQVALQANYYVGYPSNLPQPIGVNQTPSRYSQIITDRTGGLLEGGNFKENSFFTSHLGLGAERKMTSRWSMFFQSRYEYSIGYFSTGLGPTQDRINTVSFESGIRVKLK